MADIARGVLETYWLAPGMEGERMSSWDEADKAYQIHSSSCPTCRAAGVNPRFVVRCAHGQELWQAYIDAGDPPHVNWPSNAKIKNALKR